METFSLLMQFVISPLIFLSGAFFPIEKLPTWMQTISHFNPLFYALNGLRYILGGKFISSEYSGLLYYNFNFSLIVIFIFAILGLVGAIMVFNKFSIFSVFAKIKEEGEEKENN